LDELETAGLDQEIAGSKTRIEGIIGRKVDHFSCPGGRWSPQVLDTARRAGYVSVATSRVGRNTASTDPFTLARVAVMRDMGIGAFQNLCLGHGLRQMRLREQARGMAKRFLGNSAYDRLRTLLLSPNRRG
jgi:peptidoglycan/xylan/chitin deacetylase (PgdA/CDA1 family)